MDFSKRKLKELPTAALARSDVVWSLDLQHNRLKHVKGISALRHLRDLNLSRNELSIFPREIEELRELRRLYLNQNSIKTIPEGIFSQLKELEFLKLSTNHLSEIPSDLNLCKKLEYVNLSNNCLKDLRALVGLPKLKDLYVEKNYLTKLPASLFLDTGLTMFKGTENPLREPPEEVCAGGVKDIQRYFKMLGSDGLHMRRVKTMFLGSSMAGKSTICRSLKKREPVEVALDDRTVGIEISEVEMGDVRFLFWDFAGQEEYYLTHHVFITPQAFVILTIDLASYSVKDPQSFNESVSFWINNVQLRVPDSVVLLVGTHLDQCRDEGEVREKKEHIEMSIRDMLEERRENLEQRIKNIKEEQKDPAMFSDHLRDLDQLTEYHLKVIGLIPIDCTKPEEITKLQDHILCQVQKTELFPNIEKTLPRKFQEVELSIKDLKKEEATPKHGIWSFDEILDNLCTKLGELDREDLKCILRYLHRIGIIVWYEEITSLVDTVFVEPSFLITLFKTIVRHDLVKQLKDIPRNELQRERALDIHRSKWINDLQARATLHNVAIRVLLRRSLREHQLDDEDVVKEIVGTRTEDGKVLQLLHHFEICLPTKFSSPLNPEAPEFSPNKMWKLSDLSIHDPKDACLFPSYLQDNNTVLKMWGEDKNDEVEVRVYFLPEIPHGLFHRLIIKACSFYPAHWVGKELCLLSSGERLVLLKERCGNKDEDQFIVIRCRRPDPLKQDMDKCWDMVRTVLSKLMQLTEQWPGLWPYICTPCRESGCSAYFHWNCWKEPYTGAEEKELCDNGHIHRPEMLFPKAQRDTKSNESLNVALEETS
ncbi:malignant fibrous histiocytoma-amplified sequence 1 [Megalops cyprinoides]|uniref:malignant fibrous histiocytoma-amplified sequence 1 n=1 Tax=Megalops cyprinoides TaxID=118141 RepID=UPI0018642904|nr:malignant fibrous histiocytoma-amplified sequence 1 [Megalops cyprinoides]